MFVIDRFEGNCAVIELDDRSTITLPKHLLPKDAKEGDVIDLSINVNRSKTTKRRKQADSLLKDFFDE